MKSTETGNVAIVALLISVALLAYIAVRFYTSPTESGDRAENTVQPLSKDGSVPQNRIEQYQADLDAARNVQELVDHSNSEVQEYLEQ